MGSPLKPLGDFVVAVSEEAEAKTASGLYIPESAKEKPVAAKVVAVGPDVKEVKVGDSIISRGFGPEKVSLDGKEYTLVQEKDIIATVK